ncbi:MAG: hypothetical protein HY856_05400 [Burkholderiales bacterium]|nr:hypothetical protein [Burkholderiales bacterium]
MKLAIRLIASALCALALAPAAQAAPVDTGSPLLVDDFFDEDWEYVEIDNIMPAF